MGNDKRFTIIVPFYLSDEQKCGVDINPCRIKNANILVGSLAAQTFPRDQYEMILVADESCQENDLYRFADRVLHMQHRELFNKSWFFNTAARQAMSDWLFFLDLDVRFPSDYLQTVADNINNKGIAYSGVYFYRREVKPDQWTTGIYPNLGIFGYATIMHKDLYWAKGGMCENFRGYGGEDGEMYTKHKPYIQHIVAELQHPYHDDKHVDWDAYSYNCHLCQVAREHLQEYLERLVPASVNYGNPEKEVWINFDDLLKKTVNPFKR